MFTPKESSSGVVKHWKEQIALAWLVKQALLEAVSDHKTRNVPGEAASELDIQKAEEALGFRIDPSYRNFLSCANGWKAFWKDIDLLGTQDLIQLAANSDHDPSKRLFPIARSKDEMIVISLADGPTSGAVIWFAEEEIDRFANFEAFFSFVVDWHRKGLRQFQLKSRVSRLMS